MSEEFTQQARIAASPEDVYRALTDARALRTWFAEHAEVSLSAGTFAFWGKYTPQGTAGRQRLLAFEPDRLVRFAWTLDGTETTAEITLQQDGPAGTVLTLSQTGAPTMAELMAPTGRRDGLHSLHTFWGLAIANLAEYLEGRELTPKCDFRADRAGDIRVVVAIDATAERVFESLIDPKEIAKWFGWEIEIEPRVGGRIAFGAEGEIFELEPGRTLAYTEEGGVTRWELTESGGKTYLTLVQSGFADASPDNAAQHEAGWLGGLAELKRMHELGSAYRPLAPESGLSVKSGFDAESGTGEGYRAELRNAAVHGAGGGTMPEMETDDALTLRAHIAAPVATVYGGLIDAAALRTWFAEHAVVDLDGGRYEFWGRHTVQGDRVRQRLLGVEPERSIRFAWELDGAKDAVATITLRPQPGNGTVLRFALSKLPAATDYDGEAVHTFLMLALDNLANYVEGRRLAPLFDFSRPATDRARAELTIDAPVDRVYASLTEPGQVDRWTGGAATIEPEVGGRYDYGWEHGPVRILELEPERTVAHSWTYPGSPETVVRWELEESQGKTKLIIVHSGFDDPGLAESFRMGWYGFLHSLRRLHERGDAWALVNAE
ncbi:MAG: hypothetical protein GEU98_13805 [Pseudonocardiaceae bacterium]|nr:hypothetical protein [Pseudonocardiaceae bacterium]